ncbi:MAG: cyclase family protein [Candidatus Aenigmarchaeota archaeon]|nr:cyclase family protein [Candidatus Aenigmarchaeota archaeon]
MKVLDLTQILYEEMDIYPGDPKFRVEKWSNIDKDGYSVHQITFGSHTGTHIDAQSHMIINGKTVDKIKPEELVGTVVVLKFDTNQVTKKDIENYDIPKDSVVLITTKKNGYLKKETAEYLVSKKIKLIGFHKNCIVDKEVSNEFACHKIFLKNNIPIVTGIINTDKVGDGDLIIVAPLNIKHMDGSPCRVFAIKV